MVEAYFGLSDAPFRLSPDAKFYFGSRGHNKAMAYLHFGLKQAEGFIVITGPVGSGKTLVINHLLDQLDRSNVIAAQLQTASIEPNDLLARILAAFQIEAEGEGRTGQIEAFEDYLYDQLQRGRRVLLILDEAQNLPLETLEELRMLSNIDYDGTPMFQVFLVGQPEFRRVMASEGLEQLRQRVIASHHLEKLSADETREYILHRLSVVEWRRDPVFTEEAFQEIFRFTSGLPRRINLVCNRLMLCASMERSHEIDKDMVLRVVAEMRAEHAAGSKATTPTTPTTQGKPKDASLNAPKTESAQRDVVVPMQRAQTSREAVAPRVLKQTPVKRVAQGGQGQSGHIASATDETVEAPPIVTTPPTVLATPVASAPTVVSASSAVSAPQTTAPSPEPTSKSQSVLDRVRAERDPSSDLEETPEAPRSPATLDDVASAIAAASNAPQADDLREALKKSQTAAAIIAQEDDKDHPAASDLSALRQSLERAREEIKEAQGSLADLREALTGAKQRHIETRADVVKSLTRAQSLLVEIGDGLQ